MAFVHLHNHTEYSLLDGATHVYDMVLRAAELGQPAVAITDHGVMSGVPELAEAVGKVEGKTGVKVKPIYGCEVYFTTDGELKREGKPPLFHMILLAKTNTGYHNLVRLVSESHVSNYYYKPRTTLEMLERYGEGLIGTSACLAGVIPKCLDERRFDDALMWANRFKEVFEPGDFYIELQNQGLTTEGGLTQTELNRQLSQIAQQAGLKTVATNDFHYLNREDANKQDLMLCIGTGSKMDDESRMRFSNDEFYMKSEEEMREALADFPEACDTTIEIADKCNVELERDSILPRFPLPEGETEESWFRHQCEEGLAERYGQDWREAEINGISVLERYEHEAGVIIRQGFPAYFLIVQEYIMWAKNHGIGVGPGRGSAAGAIVAYAMGITDLEPLANGLLFERFLSEERVEMPDIDVDFDDARRQDVIDHVREVYGEDHVAGVITFGTLQAKNAVRDAARVMDKPYSVGDRICKMIGDELGITIEQALGQDGKGEKANPDLITAYDNDEEVREVIDAARSIEGNIRGEGVHACATIICRDPMSDHVPLKRDTKGGSIITQYDGHYTPDLGLLKMDFLGLRTLGVITGACRNIKETCGVEIRPDDIPLDDPKAFELMCNGNMDGLFQVESALYVSLFARMKPRQFSDIVASIALNRPGPLQNGFVDDYVNRVSGRAPVVYYDDRLRPILEETYGTIVYQEQLMQISMAMSDFSPGKADKLRKAMGKKKIDVMMELEDDWNNGAVANGYALEVAQKIWEDAKKFAEYAFNKSHSACYAVLVMRTAYLKAHYPYEFMAAVLSSYMGKNDRLTQYISSCSRSGIPVLPPDINSSNQDFTPTPEGVRFGLAGVRGVGGKVVEEIVAERKANGPYTSLHDFVARVDSRCYNRKTLEALVKAGAFDSTGYTRRQLMYFLDETSILEAAAKRQKDRLAGQGSIFDMFAEVGADSGMDEEVPPPDGVEWERRLRLAFEKEILGVYVSDHPLNPYRQALTRHAQREIAQLVEAGKDVKNGKFAGMVSGISTRMTKTNKKMASFMLEDTTGQVECICFDYEKKGQDLAEDAIVAIEGKFEHTDRGDQIIAYKITALDLHAEEAERAPGKLELAIPASEFNQANSIQLNRILQQYPGRDGVELFVTQTDGRRFRAELPMTVDSHNMALLSELGNLFGRPIWKAS